MQRDRAASRRQQGFTLVELMVVVLITAILAAVAVPLYKQQVRKSRRTEARTAILDLASREERMFSTRNSYAPNPATLATDLGYATLPVTVGSGYYQLNVVATATTFVAQAIPITADQQADSQCQLFQVDNVGRQSTNSAPDGSGTDTTSTCW